MTTLLVIACLLASLAVAAMGLMLFVAFWGEGRSMGRGDRALIACGFILFFGVAILLDIAAWTIWSKS